MLQAVIFRLEPCVDVGELSTKIDHRMHRFSEEPEAHGATPTSKRKLVAKAFVGPGGH